MTRARQRMIHRMRQLATKTATVSALSMQVLGCDPMTPPAREPPPGTDNDASASPAPMQTTTLGTSKPDGG